MTRTSKLSIVAAALVAGFVVTSQAAPVAGTGAPAPLFWQLQGASPSARESDDVLQLRTAARAPAEIVVAAR